MTYAQDEIPTVAIRCFAAAIFLVLSAAAAGASADDEDQWLRVARPAADQSGWLLRGLLTWPKDQGDKEKENQGGEKKDDQNKDEEKEEPLESDRPDFTDSSTTVGLHRFQIESGYTYTHGEPGDPRADVHDLPEMLLRYGVAERLELRLAWDEGMVFSRTTNRAGRVITEDGSTNLAMGFKYAMTKQPVASPIGDQRRNHRPRGKSRLQQPTSGHPPQLPLQLGPHQAPVAELQHGQHLDQCLGRPTAHDLSPVRIR